MIWTSVQLHCLYHIYDSFWYNVCDRKYISALVHKSGLIFIGNFNRCATYWRWKVWGVQSHYNLLTSVTVVHSGMMVQTINIKMGSVTLPKEFDTDHSKIEMGLDLHHVFHIFMHLPYISVATLFHALTSVVQTKARK